jgi:hypothetical protein
MMFYLTRRRHKHKLFNVRFKVVLQDVTRLTEWFKSRTQQGLSPVLSQSRLCSGYNGSLSNAKIENVLFIIRRILRRMRGKGTWKMCPWFDSTSTRNMYQKSSGGKGRPARKAINLTTICEPGISQRYGLPRPVTASRFVARDKARGSSYRIELNSYATASYTPLTTPCNIFLHEISRKSTLWFWSRLQYRRKGQDKWTGLVLGCGCGCTHTAHLWDSNESWIKQNLIP